MFSISPEVRRRMTWVQSFILQMQSTPVRQRESDDSLFSHNLENLLDDEILSVVPYS